MQCKHLTAFSAMSPEPHHSEPFASSLYSCWDRSYLLIARNHNNRVQLQLTLWLEGMVRAAQLQPRIEPRFVSTGRLPTTWSPGAEVIAFSMRRARQRLISTSRALQRREVLRQNARPNLKFDSSARFSGAPVVAPPALIFSLKVASWWAP